MAFTAYGKSYPRIELEQYTIPPDTGWVTTYILGFDADDLVKLTPTHPEPVKECGDIELEDGSMRAFIRGWRLRWGLSCKGHTNNTLTQFIYDYMLDWLKDETSADLRRIKFWPHYDVPATYYYVRVVHPIKDQYWDDRWVIGIEFDLVLETVDIEASVPYSVIP